MKTGAFADFIGKVRLKLGYKERIGLGLTKSSKINWVRPSRSFLLEGRSACKSSYMSFRSSSHQHQTKTHLGRKKSA